MDYTASSIKINARQRRRFRNGSLYKRIPKGEILKRICGGGQSGNWLSYRDNLWGLIESEKFPNRMVEALDITIIDRRPKERPRKRES